MTKEMRIRLRHLKPADHMDLREAMVKAYPDMAGAIWPQQRIEKLIALFPEGQFCVSVNGKVVAIAGSVGNLPKVENMDIQFAQSTVSTPSGFAFPTNGIKGETTPNTEMTLIVDVDRDLLKELNAHGSVRIMRDRRTDLYELKMLKHNAQPRTSAKRSTKV